MTFSRLNVSHYLRNDKVIAEYLNLAAADENPDVMLKALAAAAKAKGMARAAAKLAKC